MATKPEMRIALTLVDGYKARYALYVLDCEDDRERGFRPHYCEHGTNQWTDYDNICGGCESGMTLAGIGAYEAALGEALSLVHQAHVRNLTMELDRRIMACTSKTDAVQFDAWQKRQDRVMLRLAWADLPHYGQEQERQKAKAVLV